MRDKIEQAKLEAMISQSSSANSTDGVQSFDHFKMADPFDEIFKPKERNSSAEANDDESYIWETVAQKSLVLFPHSPFCDLAAACFSFGDDGPKNLEVAAFKRNNLLWAYFMQIFDFLLFFAFVTLIDNYKVVLKMFNT